MSNISISKYTFYISVLSEAIYVFINKYALTITDMNKNTKINYIIIRLIVRNIYELLVFCDVKVFF